MYYSYNVSITISDFKKNQINEFGPTAPNLWFDCAKMFLKQVIIYYIFSQYLSVFIEIVLYLHSNSIVNDFCLKQKENVIASIFWCNSQTWTNGHYLRRPFYLSFYLSLIIWSSSLSTSSMFSARKKCRILNTLRVLTLCLFLCYNKARFDVLLLAWIGLGILYMTENLQGAMLILMHHCIHNLQTSDIYKKINIL